MICPVCAGDTPDAGRFCVNCGAAIAAQCPTCHAELIAGKPFCAECGARVLTTAQSDAAPSSTPGTEPVAERRLCSVLFVDLVGFTSFAESRDPEEVRELLSRYFETSQTIIENYGGTLEKFIGDAVTALWGAPVAAEDDAELAVRAALEVVEAVRLLGETEGVKDLLARAGVVTGEAAVTVGRVAEGMVLGDTVNTAARIQTSADPGTVLVDESTWRAASQAIAFEFGGELTLKGKAQTVRVWRAERVVARRGGQGRSERLEPPFVGRDAELRMLKEMLHATARESRARIVSVSGIPGIGKSRLAWEFLKYVDGLAETYYWHQGRSRSRGEGVSFGALAEMVRMRAGVGDDDSAEVATNKLDDCLADFVTDAAEREWVRPRLAHLLGIAPAPPGERDELFGAWRTFFERVAERGPAVLVFEDLQWADPGLIDFVESLGAIRSRPVLVVTLSRPELADQRPTWGAGQRSFSSLHLEPLSRDDMRQLLTGFVAGLPEAAIVRVLDRSEGVPLYAVETIRMLLDRGILIERDGALALEGTLSDLDVPETLHALIASRLDGLSPSLRRVLQDAAVVGSTFRAETVAVISGLELTAIRESLDELVRREMLFVEDDPRSPERGQFSFVQAVMREVAVGMLSRRDRSVKHLAVAHYAESLADDELAGLIASQYLEAVRATPDDELDAGVTTLAIDWLRRASARALSLGSPRESIQLDEEALSLSPSPAVRASLLFDLGDAADMVSEAERAVAALGESRRIRDEIGDVLGAARAVARLGAVTHSVSVHGSRKLCEEYFVKLGDKGDPEVRLKLATAIAGQLLGEHDHDQFIVWSEIALSLAESIGDDSLFALALGTRARGLFNFGRHREAALLAEGHRKIADRSGIVREQIRARMAAGLYMLPDNPSTMIELSWESVELCRRAGFVYPELTNLLNIAESCLDIGRFQEARDALAACPDDDVQMHDWWRQLIEIGLQAKGGSVDGLTAARVLPEELDSPDPARRTTVLGLKAAVELAIGDLDEAQRLADVAVEGDPTGINAAKCVITAGHAAILRRDLDAARRAFAGAQRMRGRFIAAGRATIAAGIAALEGSPDDAADLYRDAIDRWREIDAPLELALCETEVVISLGADHPDAVVAKEALDIFDQIGALAYRRRLDEVLSSTSSFS